MVDVTIRGAGIFGLSIAWQCVSRGAHVTVVDPHGPGAGSSGGVVGALAPHVPENWNTKKSFQLDSLLMAQAFWDSVAQAGGVSSGYLRSGRIQPILDENALDLARQRAQTAQELWGHHASWHIERAPLQDWCPISPSGWVIRDTLSALIHPRQAIDALVAALAQFGVSVVPDAADRGAVVWATGVAGLHALNTGRSRLVGSGIKGQAAVLAHNASGQPQLFADGVHFIPHLDGTVAVGSTTERDFDNGTTTDQQLDSLLDHARALVPTLQGAQVIQRWAGVRPRSRSRAPMLGPWPDKPGHFIANGGFKIGFGMAPKIAEVMADLILNGENNIPPEFAVNASF